MTGKPYTMKEMKMIVDYVTQNNAYGEIKGRKMWMDFANSQSTTRTWQSLKETFLKRILPDIHNPYYKLNMEQIRSFSQRHDVAAKDKNKLEIRTNDEDKINDGGVQKNDEQPNTNNLNGKNATTGEKSKISKNPSHDRSSTDTLIIDEDIQKELEEENKSENEIKSPTKSMRDLITYSEPLTPMLQSVLNDFATDDEDENSDKEPKMQIVEDHDQDQEICNYETKSPNEIARPENIETEVTEKSPPLVGETTNVTEKPPSHIVGETTDVTEKPPSPIIGETTDVTEKSPSPILGETSFNDNNKSRYLTRNKSSRLDKVNDSSKSDDNNTKNPLKPENITERDSKENTTGIFVSQQNSERNENLSNTTTDSTLPNNQEALKNKIASKEIPISTLDKSEPSKQFSQKKGNLSTKPLDSSNTNESTLHNNQEAFENKTVSKAIPISTSDESEPSKQLSQKMRNLPRKRLVSSNTNESAAHNKRLKQDKTKKSSLTDSGSDLKLKKNVNGQDMPMIEENHISENNEVNNLTENETHVEIITVDTNDVENKNNTTNKENSTKEKENTVYQIATDSSNQEVQQDIKTKQVKTNPCLQSVSLYEEQFSQRKYSDSESSNKNENITTDKQEKQNITKKKEKINSNNTNSKDNPKKVIGVVEEVVMLKSHSESDSTNNEAKVRRNNLVSQVVSKSQRNKALANVFGFSTGSFSTNHRKRLCSHRKSSSHRDSRNHIPSESSDWTSESDGDYISPPRARKNRHTRKYLKPQSARIMSLEEDGGLFVVYKDKIYPLVKDGKILKKHLRYFPDSDEEDESYWKKKYLEKKKKIEELTRKLEQKNSNGPRARQDSSQEIAVPNTTTGSYQHLDTVKGAEQNVAEREEKNPKQDKTVKIILTKDKSELQLDGHWQHIPPMLQQVVQILRTDIDSQAKIIPPTNQLEAPTRHQLEAPDKKQFDAFEAPVEDQFKASFPSKLKVPRESVEISSGTATPIELVPVDKEVREKVNEIERKIFNEIEQRDKAEETNDDGQVNNVTLRKRRGRSGDIPTSTLPSSSKRLKTPDSVKQSKTVKTNSKLDIADDSNTDVTKRRTGSPKVQTDNNVKPEERRTFNTRSSRKLEANNTNTEDDSGVLYKFPSPPPSRRSVKKSDANTKKKTNAKKLNKTYTTKITQISFSPDNFYLNATESSQGYQDSDISPTRACRRKKRKQSHSVLTNRGKPFRSTKKRWHPYLTADLSSESSRSSFAGPIILVNNNSTLDTEIYKSDSYQLLMRKQKSSFKQLEQIDESCPVSDETKTLINAINTSVNSDNKSGENSYQEVASNSFHGNTDGGTSSNVSLPLSPELSIVENISISKDILANIEEHPIINDTQGKDGSESEINNQYTISKLDASMPLMEQECRLQETYRQNVELNTMIDDKDIQSSINHESMDYNSNDQKSSLISESLLEKICTVNINESSSDFIGQKLQELILQSAKKSTKQDVTIKDKLIGAIENKDTQVCVVKNNTKSKTTKKRSSTPLKKKNAKNAKHHIEPVIEEEHMESCSYGSRRSLRSSINVLCSELNTMDGETFAKNKTVPKSKSRKKKDVIKVKILKPNPKKKIEVTQNHSEVLDILDKTDTHNSILETANRHTLSHTNISLYTKSGINDTESGVFLQDFDNSVELIHNHSDTCLHANECMADSVEFVKTNSESIISLILDTSNSSKEENDSDGLDMNNEKHKPEPVCKNTQAASNLSGEAEYIRANNLEKENTTSSKSSLYYTPLTNTPSPNSLITEDLSDEVQPSLTSSNWYLFSEDENTNTNVSNIFPGDAFKDKGISFGANLNHLFPITCAVPDLSTITEISKDADENSQQKTDARADQSGTYSQSIFDSNN